MANRYGSILSTVLILSSLSIFAEPGKAQTQQVDFNSNSGSDRNAQTKFFDFTLGTQSIETFADLIQQAELRASSLISEEFTQNPSITEITVSNLADGNGQKVPLLVSQVSRSDWQIQPRIEQWTKYFSGSAALLGFPKSQIAQSPSPSPTNVSPPPPPTNTKPSPSPTNTKPSPTTTKPSSPTTTKPSPTTTKPSTSGGTSRESSDPGYR